MQKRGLCLTLLVIMMVSCVLPAQAAETDVINGYTKSAGYDYVLFGAYPTDADGTVQPILWRVLKTENGEAYLLSEYILFGSPVHGDYEHYQGWENSDLYRYLNTVFLQDAFTPEEQAALLIRTEDQALVTLITSDEMKDASLGFSSNNARLCESTAWAKVLPDPPIFELPATNNKGRWKPLYIYSKGHKYSPWWSRTRSADYPHEQRRVMDEGKVGRISTGNSDLGVRPAIHVDLRLLSIASGTGSFDSPYVLSSQAHPAPAPVLDPTQAPDETATPAQDAATEAPAVTDAPTAADLPTPSSHSNMDPVMDPVQDTGDHPAETPLETPAGSAPEAAAAGFTAAANPAFIHEKLPSLTDEGFLPAGEPEFVYKDNAAGLWLYASQTLRIEINRRTGVNSKKEPLRWYEAQIFTRDASEMFDLYPYDEENYTRYGDRYKALADQIAIQHHLVFAINSDFFIYRIERDYEEDYDYPIGLEIRNGRVLYDRPRKATSTTYPPLDVMALNPDGSISLYRNATVTAQELLDAGVKNALSFGPILVENGAVSPRSKEYGTTPNPRTAFGMVEPGYYIAVMVESRIEESKGESCVWLGEKMAELGCFSAMNLDGGATSTMLFMGEQINKSGNYRNITNRLQNELFGIGHSDAVQ
ncbi:MAG: phosphodiester glycosidase family protein [Clostridia bacterium]|nr:phosphodiester glycosidase family protein [Clostridia bacterium]